MELTVWGVRGCFPAPGAEFSRFGGNTTCIAVRGAGGEAIILDAGTGLIGLGKSLMGEGFGVGTGEATLLLTHAHWDHIQGFPFFVPVHIAGNRFRIVGSQASPHMLEAILEGQMNPHFMPVQSLRNLKAAISFEVLGPGHELKVGGITVSVCVIPHGSLGSLAFRLQEGPRAMVFVPDAGYREGLANAEVLALYHQANLLIHDCTYSGADYASRKSRGYSSVEMAARAATMARVERLMMFHYDQDYDDARVDQLAIECREQLDGLGGREVELVVAAEGMTVQV